MHLVLIEFSPKAQAQVGFTYCHAVLDRTKPEAPQVLEWYRAIYHEKPEFGADDFAVTPASEARDAHAWIYDVNVTLQDDWNSPHNAREDAYKVNDHGALDQIQTILRKELKSRRERLGGEENWSRDTREAIVDFVRASGREIYGAADNEDE